MPQEVIPSIASKEIYLQDGEAVGFVKNDANGKLQGGHTSSVNLEAITSNVIANVNDTYNLGSLAKKWAALFVVLALVTSITVGNLIKLYEVDGTLYINASTYVNGSMNVSMNITSDYSIANFFAGDGSLLTNVAGATDTHITANLPELHNDSTKIYLNVSHQNNTILDIIRLHNQTCIQITGSADLCDGSDDGAGSGTVYNNENFTANYDGRGNRFDNENFTARLDADDSLVQLNVTNTGNLNITHNISQPKNSMHCFGDNCDGYIYYNGSAMIIGVN